MLYSYFTTSVSDNFSFRPWMKIFLFLSTYVVFDGLHTLNRVAKVVALQDNTMKVLGKFWCPEVVLSMDINKKYWCGIYSSVYAQTYLQLPITGMGCRQCLPLSVVLPKGKHCWKPHCRNGVVECRYVRAVSSLCFLWCATTLETLTFKLAVQCALLKLWWMAYLT